MNLFTCDKSKMLVKLKKVSKCTKQWITLHLKGKHSNSSIGWEQGKARREKCWKDSGKFVLFALYKSEAMDEKFEGWKRDSSESTDCCEMRSRNTVKIYFVKQSQKCLYLPWLLILIKLLITKFCSNGHEERTSIS